MHRAFRLVTSPFLLLSFYLATACGSGNDDTDQSSETTSSTSTQQQPEGKKPSSGDAKPRPPVSEPTRPQPAQTNVPEEKVKDGLVVTPEPEEPTVAIPADGDCIEVDEFICAIEVEITRLTNALRPTGSPLTHDGRLSYVSRLWSEEQGQRGSIGHAGFPSERSKDFVAAFPGEKVSILAENVAYSSSGSSDSTVVAKMFVDMWSRSSGHRRNMLGNYQLLGVGIYKVGSRYYATQIFGR